MDLEIYGNVYLDQYNDNGIDKIALLVSVKNDDEFHVLLGHYTLKGNYRECTKMLDTVLHIKKIHKNHRIAKNAYYLLKLYFSQ